MSELLLFYLFIEMGNCVTQQPHPEPSKPLDIALKTTDQLHKAAGHKHRDIILRRWKQIEHVTTS